MFYNTTVRICHSGRCEPPFFYLPQKMEIFLKIHNIKTIIGLVVGLILLGLFVFAYWKQEKDEHYYYNVVILTIAIIASVITLISINI